MNVVPLKKDCRKKSPVSVLQRLIHTSLEFFILRSDSFQKSTKIRWFCNWWPMKQSSKGHSIPSVQFSSFQLQIYRAGLAGMRLQVVLSFGIFSNVSMIIRQNCTTRGFLLSTFELLLDKCGPPSPQTAFALPLFRLVSLVLMKLHTC